MLHRMKAIGMVQSFYGLVVGSAARGPHECELRPPTIVVTGDVKYGRLPADASGLPESALGY